MRVTVSTIMFSLVITVGISNAQNISNTLGSGGTFLVKDGLTTFLSLSQSSGFASFNKSLILPVTGTDSTLGVIYKGNQRFIHDYAGPNSAGCNTFVGINAGNFTMLGSPSFTDEGSYNTAVGNSSFSSNSIGRYNSAFGYYSLHSNTWGAYNSAFGYYSLSSNTTAIENSAFGYYSLKSNTGFWNSAFGSLSLTSNTIGGRNCAFGRVSLGANSTGSNNSAYGYSSLTSNTTGSNNSAFGNESLYSNTTGNPNSAFGTESLHSNTTGRENTAVGYKSLFLNVSGFQNTAVGDSALYNNTGNYNTALGYNAGTQVTTGANLTLIGIDANPSAGTAIDEITLGNIYVSKLRCNATTITSLSDRRDKKNITDLTLGLDFIMKLKPRQYNWDKRDWYGNKVSDGSKMQKTPTAGFIAQELDSLQTSENVEWLDLVLKTNPEKWEATPGNLFPIVVKAIQELKVENDSLRTRLEDEKELKEQLTEIKNLKEELIEKIKLLETKNKDDLVKLSSVSTQEKSK